MPLGSVTVTFITTAVTPDAGTPLRPVVLNFNVAPWANGFAGIPPAPSRVSKSRDGARPWKRDPSGPESDEKYPTTSSTTWVDPKWLYTDTLPAAPRATTTRFGTVC